MANPVAENSNAQVTRWFNQLAGVSPETIARVRAKAQSKLDAGANRNVMPMATPELLADYELRACVEQALLEEWDTLSGEERLIICRHPGARRIGDQVRLPNRTPGVVISQELTRRLSVLVTVRLSNGSTFDWEFYV